MLWELGVIQVVIWQFPQLRRLKFLYVARSYAIHNCFTLSPFGTVYIICYYGHSIFCPKIWP